MRTKGVESVRSPVSNLQRFNPNLTHEAFVKAVVMAFRLDYDIDVDEEVCFEIVLIALSLLMIQPISLSGALRTGRRVYNQHRLHSQRYARTQD